VVRSEFYVEIASPRQRVWDFMNDVNNLARWQAGIIGVSATNGMREGSRLTITSGERGSGLILGMEITRNDGGATLNARSISGPVTFEMGYYLSEISGGTRVEFSNHIHTDALFREAEEALQTVSDVRYKAELLRLKETLESSDVPNLR
jgi:carbon monoxide dehydrogenase subunit G